MSGSKISNLDDLIKELSESYNLSSERAKDIKLKLEDTIVEFLSKELDIKHEDTNSNIILKSIEFIDSEGVINKIVNSSTSLIKIDNTNLLEISNSDGKFNYTLLEGINKNIDTSTLIECWNCDESKLKTLLEAVKLAV